MQGIRRQAVLSSHHFNIQYELKLICIKTCLAPSSEHWAPCWAPAFIRCLLPVTAAVVNGKPNGVIRRRACDVWAGVGA